LALQSLLTPANQESEYEIVMAESGEEALRKVLGAQFAVILLDVNMPGLDGFKTAEIIHAHPRSASVPIIFITAHDVDEFSRLKGYQRGAVDYLMTPIVPQILRNKVAVFVELSKKNLLLQRKTRELAELNRDMQARQMQDLKRINASLECEIIERLQAEDRAHGLATRDSLTGLLNRHSLSEGLEHVIASAARYQRGLAVLSLDIDRFKTINDTLGSDVGDQVLIQVAARIRAAVRGSDLVARLGGDEFVVVMEALPAYPDAAEVAKKIIHPTNAVYNVGPHCLKISVSIGISLYPQDGDMAQTLLKNADLAMYHAKRQKRGTAQFFHEELNLRLLERIQLEHELEQALERNEFELYYQPKVDIVSGRVAGVEALLRWHHPRLGLIAASQFINEASESGQLVPIGEWVISAACTQAKRWLDEGTKFPKIPIAINIAIPQIHAELPGALAKALRKHGIPPSCLQLEITESLLIRDLQKATSVLREISETGITIAIDDFGTGYSSLSVLKALPIDILKIDQSFVRDLGKNPGDTAIVAAIVNMARALALRVVAEGVENNKQLAILESLGCDEYQGYYYSEPLPADMFIKQILQTKSDLRQETPLSRPGQG
jgi:diguanylate cyclase (GGDEF)-like protein